MAITTTTPTTDKKVARQQQQPTPTPVRDPVEEASEQLAKLGAELGKAGIRNQLAFVREYGKAEHLSNLVMLQASYQLVSEKGGQVPEQLGAWIQAAIDKIDADGLSFADVLQAATTTTAETTGEIDSGLSVAGQVPELASTGAGLNAHMDELGGLVKAFLQATSSGLTAPTDATSDLQGRWGEYMAAHQTAFGGIDVNALVQAVLRDAYMENTKDLMFFAQKVRWFNEVKKAIREELTRAREFLSTLAGMDADSPLADLFFGKSINTTYSGPNTQILLEGAAEALQATVSGKELLFAPEVYQTEGMWDAVVALDRLWGLEPENYGTHSCTGNVTGSSVVNSFYYFLALQDLVEGHRDNYNAEELVTDLKSEYGIDASTSDDGLLEITFPDGTKMVDTSGNGAMGEADLNFKKAMGDMAAAIGLEGYDLAKGFDNFKVDDFAENMGALMADTGSQYPRQEMTALFAMAYMFVDAGKATAEVGNGKPIGTKEGLETYIKNTEETLNSVGDDAQLANVDLQNMLQKQQQTLQMMSNISKMLHDTSMAVIRKIGS